MASASAEENKVSSTSDVLETPPRAYCGSEFVFISHLTRFSSYACWNVATEHKFPTICFMKMKSQMKSVFAGVEKFSNGIYDVKRGFKR